MCFFFFFKQKTAYEIMPSLVGSEMCIRDRERYARQPLFWRSFAYFCYRYFLKLGFLDGREGFLWHFMQGWWYRTLVDARQFEKQKKGSGKTAR